MKLFRPYLMQKNDQSLNLTKSNEDPDLKVSIKDMIQDPNLCQDQKNYFDIMLSELGILNFKL